LGELKGRGEGGTTIRENAGKGKERRELLKSENEKGIQKGKGEGKKGAEIMEIRNREGKECAESKKGMTERGQKNGSILLREIKKEKGGGS
jgi:hypothetical protein